MLPPSKLMPPPKETDETDEDVIEEVPDNEEEVKEYKLVVNTGDDSVAGKSERVGPIFATLYGLKGKSDEIELTSKDAQFRPGGKDEFKIKPGDIGELTKLRIKIDIDDEWLSWHLTNIEIFCDADWSRRLYLLNIDRCLGIARKASCSTEIGIPIDSGDPWAERDIYYVTVEIGSVYGSDSDVQLYIKLDGQSSDSGQRWLQRDTDGFRTQDYPYREGQCRRFSMEAVGLGSLTGVLLGHQCESPGGGLYVTRVIIEDQRDNQHFIAPCEMWLDQGMHEGAIERYLPIKDTLPGLLPAPSSPQFTSGRYTILLFTAATSHSSFCGPLHFTATDTEGVSLDWTPLNKTMRAEDLTAGHFIEFDMKLEGLGPLDRFEVVMKNPDVHWILDKVVFTDSQSASSQLTFLGERHFGRASPTSQLVHHFSLSNEPLISYFLAIQTHEESTQSKQPQEVLINITGSLRSSGSQRLIRCVDGFAPKFSPNSVDVFDVTVVDIGQIVRVSLTLDAKKNIEERWIPERLSVQMGLLAINEIPFVRSTKKSKDESIIEYVCSIPPSTDPPLLTPDSLRSALLRHTWPQIDDITAPHDWLAEVWTSNEGGACIYPLSITLCGTGPMNSKKDATDAEDEKEDEDEQKPEDDVIENLENGGRHELRLESRVIGELTKIRLVLRGDSEEDKVKIEKVKLTDFTGGHVFLFPFSDWLISNHIVELPANRPGVPPLPSTLYRLTARFQLADGRGAVSDLPPSLHCILYGQLGDSGKRSVADVDHHEMTLTFEFTCLDVGQITSLKVGHSEVGRGRGIYISVIGLSSSDKMEFPCHRWLDSGWGDLALSADLYPVFVKQESLMTSYRLIVTVDDVNAREILEREAGNMSVTILNTSENSDIASKLYAPLSLVEEERDEENEDNTISFDFQLHAIDRIGFLSLRKHTDDSLSLTKVEVTRWPYSDRVWMAFPTSPFTDSLDLIPTFWRSGTLSLPPPSLPPSNMEWIVTAQPNAPTLDQGTIKVQISGSEGDTDIMDIDSIDDDMTIQYNTKGIGDPVSIRLSFESHSDRDTWELSKLTFEDPLTGATFSLSSLALRPYDWLSRSVPWPGLTPRLPIRYDVILRGSGVGEPSDWSQSVLIQMMSGAGRSQKVCLGEKHHVVEESLAGEDTVSIRVTVESLDLGWIDTIKLVCTADDPDSGVFVEDIRITSLIHKNINFYFPCSRWLDSGKEDGSLSVDLHPELKQNNKT